MGISEMNKGNGELIADIDGQLYFKAETFIFHKLQKDLVIQGETKDKPFLNVTFCVPYILSVEVPHKISLYKGEQGWGTTAGGLIEASASVTITINRERNGASGTVDFPMVDGRKLTADFSVWE
jgi:hypothetical protein